MKYTYTGWRIKNVPNFRTTLCNRVLKINKVKSVHILIEQTSPNKSKKLRLKHLRISCDTNEIVLHFIKQCLQAVHHLCRRCSTQAMSNRHSYHQSN